MVPNTNENETSADHRWPEEPVRYGEASRFTLAQSWWLAAELVRRHPEQTVFEMHPGGGTYDVLMLVPEGAHRAGFMEHTRIMLNRHGSIQVHFASEAKYHDVTVADWQATLEAGDAHQYVKAIEAAAGLALPVTAPPSTPRALAYRLIATTLGIVVNDRHWWEARSEPIDTSGYTNEQFNRYIEAFPYAVSDLRSVPQIDGVEPASQFWALLRDNTPVAIISAGGAFYRGTERVELATEYRKSGRQMTLLATRLLGELLP